jgi:hypothetical protein
VAMRHFVLQHPIVDDLQGHATDPGPLTAGRTLICRRQGQQTPACGPSSIAASLRAAERAPKSHRSGMGIANLLIRHVESVQYRFGNPTRITLPEIGYMISEQ